MLPRDRQPELMDDPSLPKDQHEQALVGLSRLNRLSGIAGVTHAHIRKHAMAHPQRPTRLLDVASGSADVPIMWAKKAERDGLRLEITATDISPIAVEQQQRQAATAGVKIHSLQLDCLKQPLPGGFDIVTCSLFMHHLDDHQAFKLLQSMQAATKDAIVICDLERSRLNLALVTLGAHLVTRSPIVHTDASLSVRAAYTAEEFKQLAQSALARPVRIHHAIPCRFIATFDEQAVCESSVAFA